MAKTRIIGMNPTKYGLDLLAFLSAILLAAVGIIAMIASASSERLGSAVFFGLACLLPGVMLGLFVPFHLVRSRGKLILEDEWLIFRTVLGKVRGQIPLRNLLSAELVWHGQEENSYVVGIGINLRRLRDRDTFWFLPGRDSHDIFLWNYWEIEAKELKKILEKRGAKAAE